MVERLWNWTRREHAIRRGILSLELLDERTLRDIGIEDRGHIPDLVRQGRPLQTRVGGPVPRPIGSDR
jgi:uncharacterized protein YjiS (DUF1127 family)